MSMLCWYKAQNLQNKDLELQKIKELLLSDELDQLKKLESKLDTVAFEAQDDDTIMKRVTPAISKGIANNKEAMIDALYPIMGGMISKYVTQAIKEMMDTINKKIESGLSFERYKRKAKAKLTGVSETELLLEESSTAHISSLFVIHKDTSLLIAEAHMKDKEIDDPHMVASMASAIKDFINDWTKNNETSNEVQMLSYGNATLYIESAGSVFVIAFLDAEPNYEQRTNINTFFATIVKEYAGFFQSFDGDDSAVEVETLAQKMQVYIDAQKMIPKEKKNKTNVAKYIFYFLGLILFVYAIYLFNAWYIKNSLEQTVYNQTGEKIFISEKNEYLVLSGQVASTEVMYEIEKIMNRYSKLPLKNNLLVPMYYIDKRIKEGQALEKDIVISLEHKLELLERNFGKSVDMLQKKVLGLNNELKDSEVRLIAVLRSTTNEISGLREEKAQMKKIFEIKSEIFSRLDEAFMDNNFYLKDEHALDFRKLPLFLAGNAVYTKEAIVILGKSVEKYMGILVEYKEYLDYVLIEGHSDSSGLEDENVALSNKRALVVKYYMERFKIVKQYHMKKYLKTVSYGSKQAIIVDGIEDKNASRRIKITFELKESQILKILGKIIND